MDRYEIEIQNDTATVLGIADGLDVRAGEEFLRIRRSDGYAEEIRADRIRKITVLTRPSRFTTHLFATGDDA